jgi:hypothetical protein
MDRPPAQELKPQEFTFETLNMQVGVRLQLLTQRGVKPVPHFSTLIGWVKDEYIIVRIPMENGAPIGLTEGERVTVRVFSGVNVCSFACSVERVFARPLSYVHLSFPTSIQGTSLRGAMRVKAEVPALVNSTARPDAAPIRCMLSNLSVTGARVDAPSPLPHGEELINVQFTLVLPGYDPECHGRKACRGRGRGAQLWGAVRGPRPGPLHPAAEYDLRSPAGGPPEDRLAQAGLYQAQHRGPEYASGFVDRT